MQPTHIKMQLAKEAMGNSMMKVGPRPDRWIMDVIQQLHAEHPYIAQYALQGKLVSSDAERLYGVGFIEARTPTESKQRMPASRIPFVIENGMLHPLKVFLDAEGRADLLDKDVFAEAMFAHPVALSLSERGQTPSLIGDLYPPDRTRYGFMGGMGELTQMKIGEAEKQAIGMLPYLAAAGGAIGGASGDSLAERATGAVGGAGGAVGGHLAGEYLGGALAEGIRPGWRGAGKMIGGALGTGLGAAAGTKYLGGMGAEWDAKRQARNALAEQQAEQQAMMEAQGYKYSGAAPYLGDEAEKLAAAEGVRLTDDDRRAIHKKAMARLNEDPRSSVLNKIAHTIARTDQQKIAEYVLREGLDHNFVQNGFQGLLTMALSTRPPIKEAALQYANVVQVERLGDGRYFIKTADTDAFEPSGDTVSVQDAAALVGEDLVGALDADGRVTMTTQPATERTLDDIRVENIADYGIYKVQELESGEHLLGWVITNVVDFDMNHSTLKLFNSGREYALQEDIAGVRVAMGQALPRKVPVGGDHGVFYYAGPSGRVTCTLPVTIMHTEEADGQTWFAAVDLWGKPVRLTYAPDLKRIVELPPIAQGVRSFAVPDYMMFMPLFKEVRLIPDTTLFAKLAQASTESVEIISDRSTFSLRGPCVEKLAAQDKHFISDAHAEFILAALGVPVETAREKLAQAYLYQNATIKGVRPVVTKQERQEKIAAIAHTISANLQTVLQDLRKDTIKIAAQLPEYASPESVDAVLSLNFINEDNLTLFLESLPHLISARRDLAELYLAAVLGLPDVNKPSIIRGMESLRDVCDGLRRVKMRAMLV